MLKYSYGSGGIIKILNHELIEPELFLGHTKLILCFTDPAGSLFQISNKNVIHYMSG